MLVACFVVGGIWLFIGVVVIVGNTIQRGPEKGHFQAPTPVSFQHPSPGTDANIIQRSSSGAGSARDI